MCAVSNSCVLRVLVRSVYGDCVDSPTFHRKVLVRRWLYVPIRARGVKGDNLHLSPLAYWNGG